MSLDWLSGAPFCQIGLVSKWTLAFRERVAAAQQGFWFQRPGWEIDVYLGVENSGHFEYHG